MERSIEGQYTRHLEAHYFTPNLHLQRFHYVHVYRDQIYTKFIFFPPNGKKDSTP